MSSTIITNHPAPGASVTVLYPGEAGTDPARVTLSATLGGAQALADLTTAIEAAQDKARAAHDALRAVMRDAPAASMEESIAWTAAQNVATVIRDLAAIRERL